MDVRCNNQPQDRAFLTYVRPQALRCENDGARHVRPSEHYSYYYEMSHMLRLYHIVAFSKWCKPRHAAIGGPDDCQHLVSRSTCCELAVAYSTAGLPTRIPFSAVQRIWVCHYWKPHDAAISLFCSCASVSPSGAWRYRTISDCLKYNSKKHCVTFSLVQHHA